MNEEKDVSQIVDTPDAPPNVPPEEPTGAPEEPASSGTPAPPEPPLEGTPPPVEPTQETIEDKAAKMGWKADGELGAEEYVNRQPLYDRIRKAEQKAKSHGKKLEKHDEIVENLTGHVQKLRDSAHTRDLARVRAEHKDAVIEGDDTKVEKLNAEMDEIYKDRPEEPQEPEPEDKGKEERVETAREWIKDNPWFKDDEELNAFATTFEETYGKRHPDMPITEILEAVGKATRRAYPEKFKNPKRSEDTNTMTANNSTSSGKLGMADLKTDLQRGICKSLVAAGTMTAAEYAQDLKDMGEI